jgi:hypothetical protein
VVHHVAEPGGVFEVQLGGGGEHLLVEFLEQFSGGFFAAQDGERLFEALAVFLRGDLSQARRGAVPDGLLQAVLAVFGGGFGAVAAAQSVSAFEEVDGFAEGVCVGEGPEIEARVVFAESCEGEARIGLPEVGADEEVPLVVPQGDIVSWGILLDELLLQQQRLGLGATSKVS